MIRFNEKWTRETKQKVSEVAIMEQMLGQTHVYEYLGKENDPLYKEILALQVNQFVDVQGIRITRTAFGMYEIESRSFHEGFTSLTSIYERVIAIMNAMLSRI